MKSKHITITHPIVKIPFRFYVEVTASAEDIVETLEVLTWRHYLQQQALKMPIHWTDDIKAIIKGKRIIELAPKTYSDLIAQTRTMQ